MRLFLGSFATFHDYRGLKEHFSFIQGRWTHKRNLHITFLFLGEQKEPLKIKERLLEIEYEKKEIPIKGLGFFGSPPRILYARSEDPTLYTLHSKILHALQMEPEGGFKPHITLCRIKKIDNSERFIKKIQSFENKTLGFITLQLSLIESQLTPNGPIYKPIYHF